VPAVPSHSEHTPSLYNKSIDRSEELRELKELLSY